jgi:hypothetical protein
LSRGLAGWDHRRWHERPLPAELDPAFFNVAPRDQQIDAIRPSDRIVLENLHPEHPRLATRLVAAAPRVVIERPGAAAEELGMRCDTLCIDTDRGTCTLTWRAQIPLDRRDAPGRALITLARGAAAVEHTIEGALLPALDLPFVKGSAVPPPSAQPAPIDLSWGETSDALPEELAAPAGFLPFVPAVDTEDDDEGEMITLIPPPLDPPTPPPPRGPLATMELLVVPEIPKAPPPPRAPLATMELIAFPEIPKAPPLLGPLATPEMLAAAEIPDELTPVPTEPPPPIEAEPPPPSDPGLPLDDYPIERCAAVAASIARRRDEAPAILEAHALTPPLWESLDRHWRDEIRKETGRGRTALLARHDAAYVAQLEKERGPIDVATYARLVVALERNAAAEELEVLDLPRGALLRVQRLWLRRIAGDAELAKAVRAAVEAARSA